MSLIYYNKMLAEIRTDAKEQMVRFEEMESFEELYYNASPEERAEMRQRSLEKLAEISRRSLNNPIIIPQVDQQT